MSFVTTHEVVLPDGGMPIRLAGWIVARRVHRQMLFWDLVTTLGEKLQVVVNRTKIGSAAFDQFKSLRLESTVRVHGTLQRVERVHLVELWPKTWKSSV